MYFWDSTLVSCPMYILTKYEKSSSLFVIALKARIYVFSCGMDSRSPIGVEDKLRGNDTCG